MADRVIVMYNGEIVEEADVNSLFEHPFHPYSKGLIQSVPHLTGAESSRLVPIPGTVPSPLEDIAGCRFHPRCSYATDICKQQVPVSEEVEKGHVVSCWHPLKEQNCQDVR